MRHLNKYSVDQTKILGEGAFSTVRKARSDDSNTIVAFKTV